MHSSDSAVCALTLLAWWLGDLTISDLRWRYIGLGGSQLRDGLGDYLAGTMRWSASEHNFLAQALNERLWDLDCPSLAPLREPDPHRR